MSASAEVTKHADDAHAASGPARGQHERMVRFFFEPAFAYGGKTAPSVVVLIGRRWTSFLRERLGLNTPPFFERQAQAHEPDTFANGHPSAWVYRDVLDAAKDEVRWLSTEDLGRFNEALVQAQAESERRRAASAASAAALAAALERTRVSQSMAA